MTKFFFNYYVLLLTILFVTSAQAADTNSNVNANPNYDAALAKKLEADDYGMKSYVFVILTSGENNNKDKALRSEAFAGHMANINRLVKDNKLIVAGPFGKNNNNYRGLFILNVKSIEEANKLLATDPAIKAKYLSAQLYNWYGSAALGEYLPASDKVWKVNP